MNWPVYPAYTSSGVDWIGEVPLSWKIAPVRAAMLESDVRNAGENNTNYLSLMANVGVIPYAEKGDIGNKKPDDLTKCKIVRRNDFVINSMNYQIGSYGVSEYDGVCSPVYIVLQHRPAVVELRFALRIFETKSFQKYAQSFGNGILEHRRAINWASLKALRITIPPIADQRKIIKFLDCETAKIDKLIEKQKQLATSLLEDRAATIIQSVTKGLSSDVKMKDSRIQWIGEIPAGWTVQRMSWLFNTISSGTTPSSDRADYYGGDVNWVTTGELRETEIVDTVTKVTQQAVADYSPLVVYPPGALVIAMYGATIGRLGILGAPACTNQACCVFTDPTTVETRFAYYALSAAREHLVLIASGGGQPNINQDKLRSLRIAVPPKDEQRKIVDYLDAEGLKLDMLVAKATNVIATLREYRSTLVHAAVTGKIDVREAA